MIVDNAPEVIADRIGPVLHLTLNRPERLNAVNEPLYELLIEHLAIADGDKDVRCVVVAGAGRAFCSGADLKAHANGHRDDAARRRYIGLGQQACLQIQRMGTPVIAAVHGYMLGAGAELAVAADFLVMTDDARARFPEISIGTFVGGGVTHRLPRLVGLRRATDLLVLGDWFTGAQAYEWGLACAAVPATELSATVNDLAEQVSAKAPLSLAAMKAGLAPQRGLDQALRYESKALESIMRTSDWREGVAAFSERRAPAFHGR